MKSTQRYGGLLAACGLVVAVFATGPAALAEPSTQDKLNESRNAEVAASNTVESLEAQLDKLAAESNDLAMKVVKAQGEEMVAQRALEDAAGETIEAFTAADEAQSKADEAKRELGKISTAIYKDGTGTIAGTSYLFGAQSMKDANARARAFKMVGSDTDRKVQTFQALDSVASSMHREALKKQDAMQKAADAAAAATQSVNDAQVAVEAHKADVSSQRDQVLAQLAAQKGTTADLERQLQDEKEAAAAAAAEAQRQAVLAAAQAQANRPAETPAQPARPSNNTGNSSSSNSSSGNSGSSSQSKPSRPSNQGSSNSNAGQSSSSNNGGSQSSNAGSSNSGSSSSSNAGNQTPNNPATGLGAQIVAKAISYRGVPYVWGGKTPAGWDCSGFVSYIYAQFGMKVPSGSAAIRNIGKKVPYSQARPGDILWWPGHVAISLGDGRNFAALNPRKGTDYSMDKYLGTPIVIQMY